MYNDSTMFLVYIQAAMDKAIYEIIEDPTPFYGEVPELQGVWATGKTLEECRKELQSVIEDRLAFEAEIGSSHITHRRTCHKCTHGASAHCQINSCQLPEIGGANERSCS